MPIDNFLKGLFVGLSLAVPIGPIAILCIRRTLAHGFMAGLSTAIGAGLADGLYAILASFGVTAIYDFLTRNHFWFGIVGGLFLIVLGFWIAITPPTEYIIQSRRRGFISSIVETFFLTLANPFTILSFTAIFASLGITITTNDHRSALMLAGGVFSGSVLWFTFLSMILSFFRSWCTPKTYQWINRISGILILCFGIAALFMAFLIKHS